LLNTRKLTTIFNLFLRIVKDNALPENYPGLVAPVLMDMCH
jgi:hypothetical protein